MILVLLSSMVPYILPHAWLGEHYPGYDFYMFKHGLDAEDGAADLFIWHRLHLYEELFP